MTTDSSVHVSASLVLYKNDPTVLQQVLESFFKSSLSSSLLVIDNSPTSKLAYLFKQYTDAEYYHMHGKNIGFSKGHNLALSKIHKSDYHIILNPDVYFDDKVIPELVDYLSQNLDIGLIQPKIHFPNGDLQYLCKRYPTVLALFARRFIPKPLSFLIKPYLDWYEMRDSGYNQIMDVPYLSGCFMLFCKKHLDEIGYFDENIFMYLEDADISLRMAQKHRSVFYPHVRVFHHWARGSHHSFYLTVITIKSAIYFFRKNGWKFI